MFHRLINPLKTNSFFLFGARGSGKSTWLRANFSSEKCFWIDLLHAETEDRYRRNPSLLERDVQIQKPPQWVVIDEVQKVPRLLDTVHSLSESTSILFALSGSSARKLKDSSANLLAGRSFVNYAFPLTSTELGSDFRLEEVLRWGSLPKVFALEGNAPKTEYLRSYALTYLREEIQLEQIVRRIEPFRDFLEIAALTSGRILNASKIAREAGVDFKSIQNYFDILESTWIGFRVPAYHRSIRKSQRLTQKFYFFDLGVKKALERSLDAAPSEGTSDFGDAFEQWVVQEFFRLNHYRKTDYRLCYLATYGGAEIDLILDRGRARKPIAIEIKSSNRIDEGEVRKLEALAGDIAPERIFYLSRDPHRARIGMVDCLPWSTGLREIFGLDGPT